MDSININSETAAPQNAQTDNAAAGQLQINVTANVGLIPIENASITISFTGEPNSTVETDRKSVV